MSESDDLRAMIDQLNEICSEVDDPGSDYNNASNLLAHCIGQLIKSLAANGDLREAEAILHAAEHNADGLGPVAKGLIKALRHGLK